jgi:hypothetical protein
MGLNGLNAGRYAKEFFMKISIITATLLAGGLALFFSGRVHGQTPEQSLSVKIVSKWIGLGGTKESSFTLQQRQGVCYLNGKRIESKLVENVLREIDTPADTATLANLGITQSWLNENAAPAWAVHETDVPKPERTKFLATYRDLAVVESLLPDLLHGGWTDDYPSIEVTVQRGTNTTTVTSKRQNLFMIPFEITENGAARTSFNAGLSRALAALMADNFTNRERLNGTNLKGLVADAILRYNDGKTFRGGTVN